MMKYVGRPFLQTCAIHACVALTLVLASSACDSRREICTPGTVASCGCRGVLTGTQVCTAEGYFGPCSCDELPDGGVVECGGTVCARAPECVNNMLRTYYGACDEESCVYTSVDTACANGCLLGACVGGSCAGVVCDSPPASTCLNTTTVRRYTGICLNGTCNYTPIDTTCPEGCSAGACLGDPCIGVVCNMPPAPSCLNPTTLRRFTGACVGGNCDYTPSDTTCPGGCSGGACLGDPCAGVTCNNPPATTCTDASTLSTFGAGTCVDGDCDYPQTDTPCPNGCFAAACIPGCSANPTIGVQAGSACRSGTTCATSAGMCNAELTLNFTTTTGTQPHTYNTDTMCGDECDPDAANTCGSCASCSDHLLLGRLQVREIGGVSGSPAYLSGLCRANCTPSTTTNGGCRSGYTCDIEQRVCIPACTSNAECNLGLGSTGLVSNPGGPWTCNTTTGRCQQPGTAGVATGAACTSDSQCMQNGTCFTTALDGGPNGFCARIGCASTGFGCPSGETCVLNGEQNPFRGSLCLPSCTVGAESVELRLGTDGHGAGCDLGESCSWAYGASQTAGGCFPGNYNDVAAANIGDPCTSDAQCYSPFGYGRCIFKDLLQVNSGICTVHNCTDASQTTILPSINTTTTVCPSSNGVCVGEDRTFCAERCASATDCAAGFACVDTSTDGNICWPNCSMDSQCRSGANCRNESGATTGCADGTEECFCSDRVARG